MIQFFWWCIVIAYFAICYPWVKEQINIWKFRQEINKLGRNR